MAKQGKEKGRCDACGKNLRVLTAIESGQRVCRTCLRELRPPKPKRSGGKARPPACHHFFTKVVGVTFKNRNGSDRQSLIRKCLKGQRGEEVELFNEEDNPFDPNAIAVKRANGDQLGYLNADLASEIRTRLSNGFRYSAHIVGIRGYDILGVNLLILVATPGATDQQAQQYMNDVVTPKIEAEFPVESKPRDRQPQRRRRQPQRREWFALCPECGSNDIRRPAKAGGYLHCRACSNRWPQPRLGCAGVIVALVGVAVAVSLLGGWGACR